VSGDLVTFFGVITEPLLVRDGQDVTLPKDQHTRITVYSEMLLQIMLDYPSLGNWRTLEEHEIEFFYNARRASLKKDTKPNA